MGAYQTVPDRTAVASYSYKIVQLNVIMDLPGGWSKELDVEMNKIFGARSSDVLKRMQNIQTELLQSDTPGPDVILETENSISFTLALVSHFII